MRYYANNIDKHLERLEKFADVSEKFTRDLVVRCYNETAPESQLSPVFSTWGERRKSKFLERRYFYTALNLLKLYKRKSEKTAGGILYFLEHPMFPGCIKIGRTQDVDDRLAQYNVGCPYRGYSVRYYTIVLDAPEAEKRLHEARHKDRLSGEWFKDGGLETRRLCEDYVNTIVPDLAVIKSI